MIADRVSDLAVRRQQECQYQALVDTRLPLRTIVIGSSTASHGINPHYLEDSEGLFNFAYDSAGPGFYLEWYKLYKQYHGAPDTVLCAVDWFWLIGKMARSLDIDSEYLPLPMVAERFIGREESRTPLLVNRFAFYKERTTFYRWIMRQSEWQKTLMDKYDRGFAPWWIKSFGDNKPEAQPIAPASVRQLKALLQTLKHDGVRVVIIQPPQYLPNAGRHLQEDALVAAIGRSYGCSVLNYNSDKASAINRDRRLFIDWAHLNEEGSTLFSRRLGADLKAMGVLHGRPDVVGQALESHRGR